MKRKEEEKQKKSKSKKETREKKRISLMKSLPLLFAVGAIAATGVFLYSIVFDSGYFTVDYTKLRWHDEFGIVSRNRYDKLSSIGKGENIFKLDIKDIDSRVELDYPEFKNCAVERRFPNELVINIFARQPAAQIDYGAKFYVVDQNAIILSEPRTSALENLPLIAGMSWRPSSRIGHRSQSKKLSGALILLRSIKESGLLKDHSLVEIDVSDHRNLAFLIDDNLQIKIGRSHFQKRLDLLKEALSSSYIDKDDLEYIDLRFDDIVFGTR